jgi:Tfp pilus assembly protein PilX
MSRFAVAFVVLGLIATYGLWAVVAMLLVVIAWLGVALYAAFDISEEIAADLAQARQELEHARGTVKALERSLANAKLSGGPSRGTSSAASSPYRRVGLHENCPDFVLSAVQKAYRVALHPDLKPPHAKAGAERQLKEAEAAFAEIRRLRGL